jgi:hypothetical protein
METKNLIAVLAVIAVTIALVNLTVTFMKINEAKDAATGYVTQTGYVNVTIASNVNINLTNATINWGSGFVYTNLSYNNATLHTRGPNGTGNVTGGNWSCTTCSGIHIQNIGTVNVSLNLSTDVNANDMFGGTAAYQSFKWNVSNDETRSCVGGMTKNIWIDVNKTPATEIACTQLGSGPTVNEMYVDILLDIPADYDTSKDNQQQNATITFEATIAA